MKLLFTFLLCLCFNAACGQYYRPELIELVNFDSSTNARWYNLEDPNHYISNIYTRDTCHVVIDSSYHNNKWQIGLPAKQHFANAYSAPNAIVTDLTQGCLPGDTSVFIINTHSDSWTVLPILSFIYRFDADTGDIAMVEVSIDTAKTWVTIFADTFFHAQNYAQVHTTNNPDWDSVAIQKIPTLNIWNFNALYRFTFISGPSIKYRDGWMIDNIWFGYVTEALSEVSRNIFASIIPNPANQFATIKYSLTQRTDMTINLLDALGREVKSISIKNATSGQAQLQTDDLPQGIYFYSLETVNGRTTGKLVVSH